MSGTARGDASPPESAGGSRLGILGMLFRIEALKTTKRLAFWVTTGIFAGFNVIFCGNPGPPSDSETGRRLLRTPGQLAGDSSASREHRPLLPRGHDDPPVRPRILVADRTAECHRRAEQEALLHREDHRPRSPCGALSCHSRRSRVRRHTLQPERGWLANRGARRHQLHDRLRTGSGAVGKRGVHAWPLWCALRGPRWGSCLCTCLSSRFCLN